MLPYSFPGDVSVPGQNRIRDIYMGCGPAGTCGSKGLRGVTALQSGQYMGAIGKVVGMRGLGATYLSPVRRADAELSSMGLGSTRDRAICQASFAAGQAGVGIATQQHTASGGGDQGWTSALGISSALMTVGGAMCNIIDTGQGAPTTPAGAPYAPPPPQPQQQSQPDWVLIGGVGVAALVVGALLFRR